MAIVFDSVGTGGDTNNNGTFTTTHNVVSNTNGILLAVVGERTLGTITGLKFAGSDLTKVLGTDQTAASTELWYLLAPSTGLGTLNGTWSSANTAKNVVTIALTGVDQTTPIAGSTKEVTANVTSGSVVDISMASGAWFAGGMQTVEEPGTTSIGNERGTASVGGLIEAEVIGADSTGGTLRWTFPDSIRFQGLAVEVAAAAGGGGATTVGYRSLLGVGI